MRKVSLSPVHEFSLVVHFQHIMNRSCVFFLCLEKSPEMKSLLSKIVPPAGGIERGGVAILMFVDPVSFGVVQWIS